MVIRPEVPALTDENAPPTAFIGVNYSWALPYSKNITNTPTSFSISGLPAGATLLLGGVAVGQNAAGYYEFAGLNAGTYKVVETQPAAYLDGKDTVGSTGGNNAVNDVLGSITLASGADSHENNFGELPAAKISGYVYQDAGNDGVRNAEPAIAGVTITLTGTDDLGNPVTASTTTNAYDYLFADPYTIVSAHASYRHRVGGKYNLRYQLNVSNVLDSDKAIYNGFGTYRVNGLGTNPLIQAPNNIRMPEPRKFTLQTSLDF